MADVATVPVIPDSAPLPLVALTPTELAVAQNSLGAWCERKIAELKAELTDAETNLAAAKKNKWRTSGFSRQVTLLARRIVFYQSAAAAVDAGFLLIPNFPDVDLFAVRISEDKKYPPECYQHKCRSSELASAEPDYGLAAGEGKYISPVPVRFSGRETVTKPDGKTEIRKYFYNAALAGVDFPVTLAHPKIIDATQKAMALRVFDHFGIIGWHRRRQDPIVVGELIDPRSTRHNERKLTFFISWHVTYDMI